MSENQARSRGRPRNPQKRQALLQASRALFLRHPVDGVTVDQVIAEAGVSRATYYRYFKDRDELLAAVIGEESERVVTEDKGRAIKALPLRDALIEYGIGYLQFLADPDTVRLDPLILYVRDTQPALCLSFYRAGPERAWAVLQNIFKDGVNRGQFPKELNLDGAVNDLIGLWQGTWYQETRYGHREAPTLKECQERAMHAVDLFLRAEATRVP